MNGSVYWLLRFIHPRVNFETLKNLDVDPEEPADTIRTLQIERIDMDGHPQNLSVSLSPVCVCVCVCVLLGHFSLTFCTFRVVSQPSPWKELTAWLLVCLFLHFCVTSYF